MAVLAKVGTLHEHLPSVLVDPCLYYCCTTHQALAALRSLCTEGCARTVRSTCVGVRNVIREFIWAAATLLCAHIRTGFFDAYCTYVNSHKNIAYTHARTIHVSNGLYTGIDPCTKNEEQPKLSSWCSNSRGMGQLKRRVVVCVASLPSPEQPMI